MKENSVCETSADGSKWWFLNGERHRSDGPAIEYANGSKWWFLNGERHREGGPAIEWADGSKSWYLNGELHREGGPAYEGADGSKFWYLNGVEVTPEMVLQYAVDSKNEKAITELLWSL